MKKFLFVLASTTALATINPAAAQQMYLPPSPGSGVFTSDYTPPSYVAPRSWLRSPWLRSP